MTMPGPLLCPDEHGDSGTSGFTDEHARATHEALIHRPRISIRLRITLGFLTTFLFTCAITIAAIIFVSVVEKRQRFLERAANFEFEIQQARRFEKNWFLYGTNLSDALNTVHDAENVLNSFKDDMRRTIGEHAYEQTSYNLTRYKQALESLDAMAEQLQPDPIAADK